MIDPPGPLAGVEIDRDVGKLGALGKGMIAIGVITDEHCCKCLRLTAVGPPRDAQQRRS